MLPLSVSGECRLRALEESDAPELYALIDRNRAHLAPWMSWAAKQDVDATVAFIDRARSQFDENDGLQAAVIVADHIIGVVGFHAINWTHRSTSIGYWLDEQHEGRGTITSCVNALVDHALSDWKLNRIEIRVAPENTRSRAIPQRLGFREEGTLRQAELVGERYLDSVVYSLLASDRRPART